MSNSVDLSPMDDYQRDFRRYLFRWITITEQGCWVWMGQYTSGREIVKVFRGTKYVVHHRLCTQEGVGPMPCVNPEHIDRMPGGFADKNRG